MTRLLSRGELAYDLEKYALQWAVLVPESPTVCAAVAHLLGRKHRFTRRVTPELSRALGLDTVSVQQAYQALYGQPLSTIFAARLSIGEGTRWRWTCLACLLENLSPFWTAFALTLTETVGAGILALPITLARMGPLAGVIVLVVFGLVNVLTLAGITDRNMISITRLASWSRRSAANVARWRSSWRSNQHGNLPRTPVQRPAKRTLTGRRRRYARWNPEWFDPFFTAGCSKLRRF